jgi:hypothetical protein
MLDLYLSNIVALSSASRRMTSGYDAYYRNGIERERSREGIGDLAHGLNRHPHTIARF